MREGHGPTVRSGPFECKPLIMIYAVEKLNLVYGDFDKEQLVQGVKTFRTRY